MSPDQCMKPFLLCRGVRNPELAVTQPGKPTAARRHMRYFVGVDELQHRRRLRVARGAELADRRRVHIKSARLMHHVHNRHTAERRVRCLAGGVPDP
ncbi:hypothetical protein BC938DRAFT_478458 [Jimgerdemannia flammicorona]|uniref:Uncharacterized protein n=1 Tax=Jimgerdemannia flammicorona TaxID=994334 RepID=A0A433QMU8_9FUNG|nr:hypothetical protein BC938DRAFT_478458 [Jimgerdemannia flammicorona]